MAMTLTKKRQMAPGKGKPPTVRVLRRRFGVPQRVFARLMSVSERSLAKFEKEPACSETVLRQVSSLSRLQAALSRVIKPEAIGRWLQEPNPAFDGLKPLEVIERGQVDRIWAMVYQLGSGNAG